MSERKRPMKSLSLYQKIEELPAVSVIILALLTALVFGGVGIFLGKKIFTRYQRPVTLPTREIAALSGIITLIDDTEFPRLAVKTEKETFELEGEQTKKLLEFQGEKIQMSGFIKEKNKGEAYRKFEIQEYFQPKIGDTPTVETVTMSGVVQPIGVSIYMQGTHTLNNDSGEIIALLEAPDDKLKLAEGAYVEVSGQMSKSVEGDLPFIKVEKITFR